MIKKCSFNQGFGANATPLYKGQGLKGHTGVDMACGYGTPVYAFKKGIVYKIIDDKRPANDGSGYWAVFIIAPDANGFYCEWQIGHLSKITCKVGDLVEPWTVIGEEGNRGYVYQEGIQITKAMQDTGDRRGAHVHWNKKQLKKLTPSERDGQPGMYLSGYGLGNYQDAQGYYYQVLNYNNGYNGSVDCKNDVDEGFRLVQEQEQKLIQQGLTLATQASKYPAFANSVKKLLDGIKVYMGLK
jgi:Peptidase family M23